MSRFRLSLAVIVFVVFLMAACTPHEVHVPTQPAPARSMYWIDLQPGWRVRVVTPIIKSDGHFVEGLPVLRSSGTGGSSQAPGGTTHAATITLKTGKNFVGYEISLYDVKPRRAGGVQVVFRTAAIHQGKKETVRSQPIVPVFRLPRNDTFIRVLHLSWGMHGNHEAAILAANRRGLLDEVTKQVQYDIDACRSTGDTYCFWVPAGLAVIPERRDGPGTNGQWVPAH
jgi:hypothetical protein